MGAMAKSRLKAIMPDAPDGESQADDGSPALECLVYDTQRLLETLTSEVDELELIEPGDIETAAINREALKELTRHDSGRVEKIQQLRPIAIASFAQHAATLATRRGVSLSGHDSPALSMVATPGVSGPRWAFEKTLQIAAGIALSLFEANGSCVSSQDVFSFTQTETQPCPTQPHAPPAPTPFRPHTGAETDRRTSRCRERHAAFGSGQRPNLRPILWRTRRPERRSSNELAEKFLENTRV